MYCQNDNPAPFDFQHYSCLFSSLLYSRPYLGGKDFTLAEGVDLWMKSRARGLISGDLNGDDDYDDEGEDEIQRYADLFEFAQLPLVYIPASSLHLPLDDKGRLLPVLEPFDKKKYYVVEGWKYNILHFVTGNGTGKKPVIYDSIRGGSLSVAHGKCVTIRVFGIKL